VPGAGPAAADGDCCSALLTPDSLGRPRCRPRQFPLILLDPIGSIAARLGTTPQARNVVQRDRSLLDC